MGFVRRNVLEKSNLRFDERLRYYNDNLFWLELSGVCDFLYLEDRPYLQRSHVGNTYKPEAPSVYSALQKDHLLELKTILSKHWQTLDDSSKSFLLDQLAKELESAPLVLYLHNTTE